MEEELVFTTLIEVGSNPVNQTISLSIANDERKGFQIDIALSLVGPLLAAISAEAFKLTGGVTSTMASSLKAHSVFLSQDPDGNPMIVFELANGALLPLALRSGDLAGLSAEMALLAAPKGPRN